MVADTLLHCGPSTPNRYIGSPLTGGDTPARCGRVRQDQVILGQLLGTGGFGTVYVANIRGRTVAVKMYHKRTGNPRAIQRSYNNELTAFRLGLKHSNVVSVLGATSLHDFEDGAWIVMEFVGEKNLQAVINDPDDVIDKNQRLSFALQIARALYYLHSINLVHLDLKPANLLLTADRRLRLADFGNCHLLSVGEEGDRDEDRDEVSSQSRTLGPVRGPWRCELAGTLAYRAPELLKGEPPSLQADIYSLGITLWQMRTQRDPYEGLPLHAVVFQVVAQELRPRRPSNDDDDPFEVIFRDLYTQCWAASLQDRPSSRDVLRVVGLWMDQM